MNKYEGTFLYECVKYHVYKEIKCDKRIREIVCIKCCEYISKHVSEWCMDNIRDIADKYIRLYKSGYGQII